MLAAVEFDDEAGLLAEEVGDVRANRRLAAEFGAEQTAAAQVAPEQGFGIGGIATKFAGDDG